ncbi:hypothetical protein [Desulfobacula phenolica]|uniref:Uncharacterized protein n=1 Tax=Desulfobacula phenolica TaxID=90732 RepID=A0A1H2J7A4_9BACT|nr:hypothetical protein [Desulfobacula phenolica]SDU52307.1 hypothetical protein SAMN04487931_1118 [Desulfobacula phenolica]
MQATDDWGHDPNVRKTRDYFFRMETMDFELIKRSGISLFDPQLRPARELRFSLFENTCSRAAEKGMLLDEDTVFELFKLCQDMAFKNCGLPVSSLNLPQNPELVSLVEEGLK